MGACCGAPTDPQDREIHDKLDNAIRSDEREIKLLLLGVGGSGKSTLFKQLEYIHGKGFPPTTRTPFQKQIHQQVIGSMKVLITRCEEYWERDPELYAKYKLYDYTLDYDDDEQQELVHAGTSNPTDENRDDADDDAIKNAADSVLSVRDKQPLTPELVACLKKLWKDSVIQSMYAIRHEICVPDSSGYFFDDLDRISARDYVTTDTDLLMVRYRTTGMQEKNFLIKDHKFKICDVGGQRNERRKWIHFYSNVTSVIFIASLSCYDELTFEDEENAMVVTLHCFGEQVNNEWFADIPFILFLNKSDLYREKIVNVPITVARCFDGYNGAPNDAQTSLEYIKEEFRKINKNSHRSIFIHVMNATNKDQVEKVFNDVQTMIINWSLERAGLT